MRALWAATLMLTQHGYPDYATLSDAEILALDCERVTSDADRFVAQCADAQATVWAKRVSVEFDAALRRVDPEMRRPVRAAQKAWTSFADATCSQWDDVKGSLSIRRYALCRLEVNRRRAAELKTIDGLSG